MKSNVLGCIMLFASTFASRAALSRPLELETVLRASLELHPKAIIAEAGVAQSEGELLSARGEFDLKASGVLETAPVGYYSSSRGSLSLYQPTAFYGVAFKAGYANGGGFPVYDGKYVTGTGGQLVASIIVPLMRDSVIDAARLGKIQAELGVRVAEESARATRAELLADAASAYYKWLFTGRKRQVYQELAKLAEVRQTYLEQQVQLGQMAAIELIDNGRLVDSRKGSLLELELAFKRESLKLALYLRTPSGPSEPTLEQLPGTLPKVDPGDSLELPAPKDLDTPLLRIQKLLVSTLEPELRAYRNQALPKVDLELSAEQGLGEPRSYGDSYQSELDTRVMGRLSVSIDVQRRKARGKAQSVKAKLSILEQKLAFARDTLVQDLAALRATVDNSAARVTLAERAVEGARAMAQAEQERLTLGQSSILAVNLREEAQRSAELSALDARLAFHLAHAEYQAALGYDQTDKYLLR